MYISPEKGEIHCLEKGMTGVSGVLNRQVCLVWEKLIKLDIYDGALFYYVYYM